MPSTQPWNPATQPVEKLKRRVFTYENGLFEVLGPAKAVRQKDVATEYYRDDGSVAARTIARTYEVERPNWSQGEDADPVWDWARRPLHTLGVAIVWAVVTVWDIFLACLGWGFAALIGEAVREVTGSMPLGVLAAIGLIWGSHIWTTSRSRNR